MNENSGKIVQMPQFTELLEKNKGIELTIKQPRPILEILVVGLMENQDKIEELITKLQGQIERSNYKNQILMQWHLDDGTKTIEEKTAIMLKESNARYYIVVDSLKVKFDFIKQAITRIDNLHLIYTSMNDYGIKPIKK